MAGVYVHCPCTTARVRGGAGASFTTVLFGAFDARVALDVAAPVERAPALFGLGELVRVVAAPAAHQVASVRPCAQQPCK